MWHRIDYSILATYFFSGVIIIIKINSFNYYETNISFNLGDEVPANCIFQFKLYKNAAEKGQVNSISKLEHFYQCGIGIEKNEIEATAELYKKAEAEVDRYSVNSVQIISEASE